MQAIKFTTLDAIRGVAAIFVVVRHAPEFFGNNFYFQHSFLAVDVFFLLSGFVIAHAYGEKLSAGRLHLKNFIIIRLVRLYPLFFFSTLLCFILALVEIQYSASSAPIKYQNLIISFFLTALFLPNLLPNMHQYAFLFPLNGVFWSLFYELLVNFQYASLAKRLSSKKLALLLIFSALILIAIAIKEKTIDAGITWGIASMLTGYARAFFGIFLGIFLYKYYRKLSVKLFAFLPTIGPLTLISLLMMAPSFNQLNWLYELFCIFFMFPLCILWASQSTVKSHPILIALGLMSYPLYVLHLPLKSIFKTLVENTRLDYGIYTGIMFLFITIIISLAIENFYERHARLALKKTIFE